MKVSRTYDHCLISILFSKKRTWHGIQDSRLMVITLISSGPTNQIQTAPAYLGDWTVCANRNHCTNQCYISKKYRTLKASSNAHL